MPFETASILNRVLRRDDRFVVMDKPTGLLSVPGIGPGKQDCLVRRVAAVIPGARIVHRLDRDTSGVIVLALDAEAHRHLSVQFQERQVTKRYIALVAGEMAGDEGEIDLPMRKDLEDTPRQIIDVEQGRPAQTRWRVVERMDGRTRVELRPFTGRSHQLRLHLKTIGFPIVGDDLYAPPEIADAGRLMLHAVALGFAHPETAQWLDVVAPCPF